METESTRAAGGVVHVSLTDGNGRAQVCLGIIGDTANVQGDISSVSLGTSDGVFRFTYTGQEWDAPTGLYNYGARFYDASTGRFINQDPAGEGTNPYAYVMNDPMDRTDPTGMSSKFNWANPFDGLGGSGLTLQQSSNVSPANVWSGAFDVGGASHANPYLPADLPSVSMAELGVGHISFGHGSAYLDPTALSVPDPLPQPRMVVVGGPTTGQIVDALAYDALDFGANAVTGWFQGNGMATNITPSGTLPGSVGRMAGYVAAMVQGGQEMFSGGEMVVGGLAGAPETFGVSLVASVAGVVLAGHGAAVAGNSIRLIAGTSFGSGSATGTLPQGQTIVLNQTGRPNSASRNNPYLKGQMPQPGTRDTGVKRATQLEVELVQKTGKGTVDWTPAEIEEIRRTGRLPQGTVGHHINSVVPYDDWAGDPRNIAFVRGQRANLQQHDGNFQNPTMGPLIDRQALIESAANGKK
jgi:RHS repeat-associated protein